ncbi:substrate-binding periplasmic protein [Chitinimonas naiadis]
MPRFYLLLCLLLACLPGWASNELLCVGAEFPYILEQGRVGPHGLAVDLLTELEPQLGFRCRFEIYPWKRAQTLVVQGKADILIGPYRTRERMAQMRFVGLPFYMDAMLAYARREELPAGWQGDLRALQGLTVGVVRGWTLGQRYEQSKRVLTLDEADTLEQSFRKLLAGRIQVVVSNERNARVVIEQLGVGASLAPLQPAIQQTGGYIAVAPSRIDKALAERIDMVLQESVRSGRVQQLSQRYGLSFPGKRYDWSGYLQQELAD